MSRRPGSKNHIVPKLHFRDAGIRVEFMLPGKGAENSGACIYGHDEVQALNSYGKEKIPQEDAAVLCGCWVRRAALASAADSQNSLPDAES